MGRNTEEICPHVVGPSNRPSSPRLLGFPIKLSRDVPPPLRPRFAPQRSLRRYIGGWEYTLGAERCCFLATGTRLSCLLLLPLSASSDLDAGARKMVSPGLLVRKLPDSYSFSGSFHLISSFFPCLEHCRCRLLRALLLQCAGRLPPQHLPPCPVVLQQHPSATATKRCEGSSPNPQRLRWWAPPRCVCSTVCSPETWGGELLHFL